MTERTGTLEPEDERLTLRAGERLLVQRVRPFALFVSALLLSCAKAPDVTSVKLPDTPPGIGFDDLRYSTARVHDRMSDDALDALLPDRWRPPASPP